MMIYYLNEACDQFVSLGATHYHDCLYPSRYDYRTGDYTVPGSLFSRHYFNTEGTEIGYCIPDVLPYCQPFVFDKPRVWGIERNLIKIPKVFDTAAK